MATQYYNLYQNGSFEGNTGVKPQLTLQYTSGSSDFATTPGQGGFDFSADVAKQGTKSFKAVATNNIIGDNTFKVLRSQAFYAGPGQSSDVPNKIVLPAGKRYRFSVWVYVPSGSPIASPNALIALTDCYMAASPLMGTDVQYQTLMDGRIRAYHTPVGGYPYVEYITCKVSLATDNWVKLEALVDANNVTALAVCVFLKKFNYRSAVTPGAWELDLGLNNINAGGALYLDQAEIFELVTCNLAPSTPSYFVTGETGVDADNGTITGNFTSSFTVEYSLDNVTWHTGPFNGLAPGTYTLYVRDTFGCTAAPVTGIIVTEFVAPPDPPDPPSGPLTVDMKPINQYNFVNWYAAAGPAINFTNIELTNCCWDLPKGYDRQDKKNRIHAPILAYLETFAFYINADTPFTDPAFAIFRLGLIDRQGMVHNSIGTLKRHQIGDDPGIYNVYCDDAAIPSDTPPGYYNLIIYRQDNGATIVVSNPMEVMSVADAKCDSVLLQWRNGFNFYKYYYEAVPLYTNKIRLRLYRIDEQLDGDLTQYRAVSTGELRNVSFEMDKYIVLEAYYFDDEANRAMMVWMGHGFIAINERLYLPKSLYKWAFDPKKKVMKGTIELFEQGFSTANRFAPLDNITVIGSDDPLLLGDAGGRIKL